MHDSPRVSIIILNWNRPDLTLECLQSVGQQNYDNYEVVVVDNGSKDDSVERITASGLPHRMLHLNRNLGYAEGNNVGLRDALSRGAEYALILNNDTVVCPLMLQRLVEFAEKRPQAGMVGPAMYVEGSPETLYALGSCVRPEEGMVWNRGIFEPANRYAHFRQPQEVDFITGCAVLVKRAVIEKVGLIDRHYYLNFEDLEWAERARRKGFETWLVPEAQMWHKVSASLGINSPAATYYMTRNSLRFFGSYAPAGQRRLVLLKIFLRTARTIVAWTIKSEYRTDVFRCRRRANLYALWDFCWGRFGRMSQRVAVACQGK